MGFPKYFQSFASLGFNPIVEIGNLTEAFLSGKGRDIEQVLYIPVESGLEVLPVEDNRGNTNQGKLILILSKKG